jgi:hypothetical protein
MKIEDRTMSATKTELDLATAPPKLLVAELMQRMSAEATFSEIVREIKNLAGVRRGLIDSREGKGSPNEEFDREIQSWLCVA